MRSLRVAFLLSVVCSTTPVDTLHAGKLKSYNYFADSVTFWSSTENAWMVELFSLIPTDGLIFIKSPRGFVGRYSLRVDVFDQAEVLIARQGVIDSTHVKTFKEIHLPRAPRLSRFSFILQAGEYQAHLTLTDLETRESLEFKENISVRDFARDVLQISDIQVATSISVSDSLSAFVKNERLVIPNVPRFVTDELNIYAEVYNFAAQMEGEFETYYSIRSPAGETVKSSTVTLPKPGDTAAVSLAIPLAGLEAGQHTLTLRIRDLDTEQEVEQATTFYVMQQGQALTKG